MITLYTIGFTKTTARHFFARLKDAGVARVLDVRLNNSSQLAGFAKRDDLSYFLELVNSTYEPRSELAPTAEMLAAYKKEKGDWSEYEKTFNGLIASRHIENITPRELVDGGCLLCSEEKPHHCHRRLVAEYLKEKWGDVKIVHL